VRVIAKGAAMSVKVRPYQGKTGVWEVDVRVLLPNGERFREKRKSPTSSKTGSQRWGEERERHILLSGPPKEQKEVPTLEQFASRFIDEHAKANRQKPSGIAAKETILRKHLIPVLGSQRLDAISNEQVQRLKLQLQDKAPKTVNNVLTVLNVLLKSAVAWKVIDTVPCSIRLLRVERSEAAFHEFDSYERLLDAARRLDWRTYLLVLLGGEGGLRVGEMVALQWTDIDHERGRIWVRHSDHRGQLTTPKNGKTRFVTMTHRLAAALRKHRHPRSGRVLCKDDGQPLTRQGAWSRVRYAARRADVPTGVHILRHTFCSHLMTKGGLPGAIQRLVGHQDATMTQRYMHLSPDVVDGTIRLLERGQPALPDGDMLETGTGPARNVNGQNELSGWEAGIRTSITWSRGWRTMQRCAQWACYATTAIETRVHEHFAQQNSHKLSPEVRTDPAASAGC
jgi:integrase